MAKKTQLKSEFRSRLLYLRYAIDEALESDTVVLALLPALYSVISYMWCKNSKDLVRYGKL